MFIHLKSLVCLLNLKQVRKQQLILYTVFLKVVGPNAHATFIAKMKSEASNHEGQIPSHTVTTFIAAYVEEC